MLTAPTSPLSIHHLLEHIKQDIKGKISKDNDSKEHKIEYGSKRNPKGKNLGGPDNSQSHIFGFLLSKLNYSEPKVKSQKHSLILLIYTANF